MSSRSSTNSMTVASTAAVGYAWNMFTSVNKMIGTQLSLLQSASTSSTTTPQPPKVVSDEILEARYDHTINLLQAINTATTKIGILIDIDTKRYHELSRIGHYLKQVHN